MDFRASDSYLCIMLARVVTMLALLAIAVVTTASAAHAARMSVVPDHAAHAGEMMQGAGSATPACDGHHPCGSANDGLCAFLCAGLSVFPTVPGVGAGQAFGPAGHGIPAAEAIASRVPDLSEHPPRLRLP